MIMTKISNLKLVCPSVMTSQNLLDIRVIKKVNIIDKTVLFLINHRLYSIDYIQ